MVKKLKIPVQRGHDFGTSPVFLTSICTILGAVMFLRFGYAVGNVGLLNALLIVVLGHMITIPTGLAISEIATNLKVGGGGEYYLISRSFGTRIGASIGIMLYASQVISIAFYLIAFSEGMSPATPWIEANLLSRIPYVTTFDPRMVSIPLGLLLFFMILKKGANIGIKLLWVIFVLLTAALITFMFSPAYDAKSGLTEAVTGGKSFITVFAICFPAFTGMTAGVGLSGDLKNPRKSIPKGVLVAILLGFLVYIGLVIRLYFAAPVEELATDYLIMYHKAYFPPIILVGLFAATLSSAVGSMLIAPRTMQALGGDKVFPSPKITNFVSKGEGKNNEPVHAIIISGAIALTFVIMGNLNAVAQIITMFFLITYGSVCLISFLEHFAGNPSYRPTFKTKWFLSLIGFLLCFAIMLQISLIYAAMAVVIMALIYLSLGFTHRQSRTFAVIFQSVIFQLSRFMKIALQKSRSKPDKYNWRPSVIAISSHATERSAPKDFLRWISHHYGFGTLIYYIKGKLNRKSYKKSERVQRQLIDQLIASKANYTVSTIVSPSLTTAVAQSVQFSGMSGLDNNTILFEFNQNRTEELQDILQGCKLANAVKFNLAVLRSTEHNFGPRKLIHIWISKDDFRNGNIMILLAFIIMEHKDWDDSEIKIFTAFPKGEEKAQLAKIKDLISQGRLPISIKNVRSHKYTDNKSFQELVMKRSKNADLTIVGFSQKQLKKVGADLFERYPTLNETLFVSAGEVILIS